MICTRVALSLLLGLLLALAAPLLRNAAADYPAIGQEQSEQHLRKALELQRRGQLDEAEQSYQRAISAYPKNTEAVRRYAVLLLKRRRFQATAEVLQQGLAQSPGDPQLEAYLAIQYCWVGEAEKALKTFERVEAHVAEPMALSFLVAECLLYNGEHDLLVRTLSKVFGRLKDTPDDLTAQLRQRYARGLLATGDLEGARRQLELLRRRDPQAKGMAELDAELDLRRGACQSALARFKRLRTGSSLHLLGVAEAQSCLGHNQAARGTLEEYLRLHDNVSDPSGKPRKSASLPLVRALRRAAVLHARVLAALGEHRAGLKTLDRALKLGADSVEVGVARAEIHFRLGEHQECLRQLAPLIEGKTPGARVLRIAVRASLRAGRKKDAREYASRLIGQPQAQPHDYELAALANKMAGRYARAIELFDVALRHAPQAANLQREFGHTLLLFAERSALAGQAQAAGQALSRAAAIPLYWKTGVPQLNLALLSLESGRHMDALNHAEAAWRQGHNVQAMRVQARALLGLGRHADALAWYQRYEQARKRAGQGVEPAVRLEQAVALARSSKPAQAIALLERLPKDLPAPLAEIRGRNLNRARSAQLRVQAARNRWSDVTSLARQIAEASTLSARERAAMMARVFFQLAGGPAAHAATALIAREDPDELANTLKPPYRKVSRQLFAALALLSQKDVTARRRGAEELGRLAHQLPTAQRARLEAWSAGALQQLAYDALVTQKDGSTVALALLERASRFVSEAPAELRHNLALARYHQRPRAGRTTVEGIEQTLEELPIAVCNLAAYEHNRGRPREALALFVACRARGASYPDLGSIIELKQSIFEGQAKPTARQSLNGPAQGSLMRERP